MSDNIKKAIFAAGCFWGVQAAFDSIEGVIRTYVGYTGGHSENPDYEKVCSDKTGHAEAVEVTFDSNKVSYETLLDVFWQIHDPTTKNRQGFDVGSQYRSAVFYLEEEQKESAQKSKQKKDDSGRFKNPIVTEITEATIFYKAEEFHQKYFKKHPNVGCKINY